MVWLLPLSLPTKSRSRAAVARRAHNPKVGGSNPPFATKTKNLLSGGSLFYGIEKEFFTPRVAKLLGCLYCKFKG